MKRTNRSIIAPRRPSDCWWKDDPNPFTGRPVRRVPPPVPCVRCNRFLCPEAATCRVR